MQNLRSSFLPAAIITLLLASCVSEIDPLFSFNFARNFSVAVPASESGIDTTFSFNIVDTADEFQKNSTAKERIETATVLKLGARGTTALSSFDSIQFFAVGETLPRVHIGTLAPLPEITQFAINPADTNLKEYFKLPQFTLEARVISSRPIAQEISLGLEHTFLIVATPRQ